MGVPNSGASTLSNCWPCIECANISVHLRSHVLDHLWRDCLVRWTPRSSTIYLGTPRQQSSLAPIPAQPTPADMPCGLLRRLLTAYSNGPMKSMIRCDIQRSVRVHTKRMIKV